MKLDFHFMAKVIPLMIKYSGVTIKLSLLAIFFGFLLAIIISMTVHLKVPVLYRFFKIYISFFRGTPLMAQIFCLYFGIIPILNNTGLHMDSFKAALISLSLASSAYMAESIRAAIMSVDKGQIEAAQSIGMTYFQSMSRIVMPQAIRIAIPTLFSSFINIVKDTSLVFAIGVKEMMAMAQLEGASGYRYLEAYISVLMVYWCITSAMAMVQKKLENKFNKSVGEIR